MRFLSPEWISALDRAASGTTGLPDHLDLVVQQVVVTDAGTEVAYHLTVGGGTVRVAPGWAAEPHVTITQPYGVAAAISAGELNAQAAIVAGALRLSGDLELLVRQAKLLAGLDDVFAAVRSETDY